MKGIEGGEPRTHSGNKAETHWTQAQVPKATARERRDRESRSPLNHGMALEDLGQGSKEIRSYFRKMNGGERRN